MKNTLIYLVFISLISFVGCCNSNESAHHIETKQSQMKINKLTIVANIQAKEGKGELLKAELLKLIPITKAEEGCIDYELHQDNNNPDLFMFYENWETRELWQKHINNTHVVAFGESTKDIVEEVKVNEMTYVNQ